MDWHTRTDGVSECRISGFELSLDPGHLVLRATVVDYHTAPIDIDLADLIELIGDRIFTCTTEADMEWEARPNGTLEHQMGGLELSLDPWSQALRISVVDYHCKPLDIDLTTIFELVGECIAPREAAPEPQLGLAWRIVALLKRYGPAFVAGMVVVLVCLSTRRRRRGETPR